MPAILLHIHGRNTATSFIMPNRFRTHCQNMPFHHQLRLGHCTRGSIHPQVMLKLLAFTISSAKALLVPARSIFGKADPVGIGVLVIMTPALAIALLTAGARTLQAPAWFHRMQELGFVSTSTFGPVGGMMHQLLLQ